MPVRTLKHLSRRGLICATAALAATVMAPAMAADNWPDKPLRLIVGFPAGSSPDLTARALAEPLEKKKGASINSKPNFSYSLIAACKSLVVSK